MIRKLVYIATDCGRWIDITNDPHIRRNLNWHSDCVMVFYVYDAGDA